MVRSVGVLFSALLLLCFVGTNLLAMEYDHTLDAKKMTFAWKVDGEKLHVKLSAETEGWVGVGFNPSSQMKDANFVLGYVKDGEVKLTDEFGTSDLGHDTDTKLGGTEDVEVLGGTEDKGMTTIEFALPLKSADTNDGAIKVDGDTLVLLAYGSGRKSLKSKHKYRAAFTVNLSTGQFTEAEN